MATKSSIVSFCAVNCEPACYFSFPNFNKNKRSFGIHILQAKETTKIKATDYQSKRDDFKSQLNFIQYRNNKME